MEGWISTHSTDTLVPCTGLFFTEFLTVLAETPQEFSKRFAELMVPYYGDHDHVIQDMGLLLAKIPEG
jgi:hypothetical protein